MSQHSKTELLHRFEEDCCKRNSCIYSPNDFEKISFDSLVDLYYQGKIMFKFLDNNSIILKAPMKDCKKLNRGEKESSECVFYSQNGCSLSYCTRPYGGKQLELYKEGKSTELYTVSIAEEDWSRYFSLLISVFMYLLSEEYFIGISFDHLQCQACGGRCCKSTGCYFSPSDFNKISYRKLRKIIKRGYISIAKVPAIYTGLKENAYVLKVRDLYEKVCEIGYDYAGGCILFDIDKGCPFSDEDRPYGGKALKPEFFVGRGCSVGYNSRQCAEEWMPYQKILKKLYDEFKEKDVLYKGL